VRRRPVKRSAIVESLRNTAADIMVKIDIFTGILSFGFPVLVGVFTFVSYCSCLN
jgi:uncharacterized membrane protein